MNPRLSSAALLFLLAACGGDKPSDTATGNTAKAPVDSAASAAIDYRAQQKKYADSIFNGAASARDVAKRLGAKYDVGPVRLRDTVAMLAAKSDCFNKGRVVDPYLNGVATIWVNMSVIGSDVIRVQESSWTSVVGNGVVTCLNDAAKGWKLNSSFGKPMAYLVQVQFREDTP